MLAVAEHFRIEMWKMQKIKHLCGQFGFVWYFLQIERLGYRGACPRVVGSFLQFVLYTSAFPSRWLTYDIESTVHSDIVVTM